MASRRHDLLQLRPEAWPALLRRRPDLAGLASVRAWQAALRPVMRRRAQPGDAPQRLPAAIALPPSEARRRLAFEVLADEVEQVRPPPLLHDALHGVLPGRLPDGWTGTAEEVVAIGERFGIAPRLFGSLMWQCVTGLPYVGKTSDLDLLWVVPPGPGMLAHLPALLDALGAAGRHGPRLDGEIVFAGIGAVNWMELLAAGPEQEVLVKTETAVAMMGRAELLDRAMCP